jgi:hypothetical protein
MIQKNDKFNQGIPHKNYTSSGKWGTQLTKIRNEMLKFIQSQLEQNLENNYVDNIQIPKFAVTNHDGSRDRIIAINLDKVSYENQICVMATLLSWEDSSASQTSITQLDECTLAVICDYLEFIQK